MSNGKKTTVYLPDGVAGVIEGAQRQSGATAEIPYLSQSELIRLLLTDATERLVEGDLEVHEDLDLDVDGEQLADVVPEHKRGKFLYEEIKEKNWLADMAGGFRDRVRDRLEKRFKSDYRPEDVEEIAQQYAAEAQLYWEIMDDDPERLQEELEWLQERLEHYAAKYQQTTWDPDEQFLSGFAGVQQAETEADIEMVEDEIRALARERLGGGKSQRQVVDAIALVYDIDAEAIREIVEQERRELVIEEQARAERNLDTETPALQDDGQTAHDAHALDPGHAKDEDEDRVGRVLEEGDLSAELFTEDSDIEADD